MKECYLDLIFFKIMDTGFQVEGGAVLPTA